MNHFQLIVTQRIADHQAAEQKKADDLREQIRAEEQAKAEKDARAAQEAEDALIASFQANALRIEHDSVPYIQKAMGMFETAAKDWENDPRPRVVAAITAAREQMNAKLEAAKAREQAERDAQASRIAAASGQAATLAPAAPAATPAPAPAAAPSVSYPPLTATRAQVGATVVPLGTRAPAVDSTATIRLGQIGERLGFALTADFLAQLGFQPVATEKGAKYFRLSDFDLICEALIAHVRTAQNQLQAA